MFVKILLKYLIPIIIAVITFDNGTDQSSSMVTKSSNYDFITEVPSDACDLWDSAILLSFPGLTLGTNVLRVPSVPQRIQNTHKISSGLFKAYKVTSIGIRNFIDKSSLTIHSCFIRPDYRLIGLGKLLL